MFGKGSTSAKSLGGGWKIERAQEVENLEVDWIEGHPAPKAVLVLLACKNCPKNVLLQDACVLQTASSALTRIDLQTVRTRRQSHTVKKFRRRVVDVDYENYYDY